MHSSAIHQSLSLSVLSFCLCHKVYLKQEECLFFVYCDRPLSVVRCASSVVCKLFCLNIFSSKAAHWILTKLHRNDPWVVPYQNCSNGSD